jgi:hypothetical protein
VKPLDSFPAFHGTRRFNTEFTRALHLFLFWARPIQSTSPHPTSPRSSLILSTHLRLDFPSGLFHSGFPTNNLYAFLFYPIRTTWLAHLILLDLIILIFNTFLQCLKTWKCVTITKTRNENSKRHQSRLIQNDFNPPSKMTSNNEKLPPLQSNTLFICGVIAPNSHRVEKHVDIRSHKSKQTQTGLQLHAETGIRV